MRRLFYIFLALLLTWAIAVQVGCFPMRSSDAEWRAALRIRGQQLEPRFWDVPIGLGARTVHAVEVNAADSLPVVVLVHGSPGSADAYLDYLADTVLSARARLIAIDRPGFGYTSGFGQAEGSLASQAAAVYGVLERVAPGRRAVLVGHSLGGPVIVRAAIDRPDLVQGLVIVAGSMDPALEPDPWWQPLVSSPPLRWLIPRALVTSNDEIIPLRGELTDMLPRWREIRCPVTVLQARNDRLVPAANADFARRMLAENPSVRIEMLPEGDHFILWSRRDLVELAIRDALVSGF